MDSNNDTQEITCKRCQDLNLKEFNKAGHKSLNVTLGEVRLGALNRCIGCKLLANAVAHYSSRWAHLGLGEVNQVTITLDTLLSSLRFRVSIRWPSENGEESQIYLQILAENNGDIPFDGFDIAHPPASSPASSNCLACIKDWLDSCDADHEDCKPDALSPFQKPRRLLRLEKGEVDPVVTLVDAQGIDSTYTALSHCWGSTNIPKTTSMCVDQYMLEGLPFSILTKTFRDAIDVTLRLQIQYIWIDSLCIVQDDRQDWMNECPKMGNIYGGAYLVIAATVAEEGALGFYTDRPPFYRFRFETSNGFCVRAVSVGYHGPLSFSTSRSQWGLDCSSGI
ncbi:HET-domain-containing protein [Hyaloscypha hepaticicola]|uniref:HET-domain-containing protein n=1 Tax=Hyaloscypha hepaticicola TaxID=2082293 RepID=A0A2J6Q7W8_9HELO|nr:HET-domain-containing protein [Hyaloscypha hepaticicola]